MDNILPRKITMEDKLALGAPYREIAVDRPPNARAWRRIERAVGALSSGVVVGQDLVLPEDTAVTPFVGREKFLPLLCVNTAARSLELARLPFARRNVGFVDPKGVRQSLVLRLLKYAPTVTVITDAPERYGAFCEQVLESLGAPVLLAGGDSALSCCAVVAVPEKIDAALLLRLDAPVISACPPPGGGRSPVLTSLEPPAPPGVGIAPSVSAAQFLGALYECCGVTALEDTVAQYGRVEGRMTTVAQFAQRIRQHSLES
jgi:hypothetical protein